MGRRKRQRDLLNPITSVQARSALDDLADSLLSKNNNFEVRSPLQEVEDLREYHPMGDDRPARSFRRWLVGHVVPATVSGRTSARVRPSFFQPAAEIGFRNPLGVAVCVRRKMRREVLFALGGQKKGSSARFRRRSRFSNTRC